MKLLEGYDLRKRRLQTRDLWYMRWVLDRWATTTAQIKYYAHNMHQILYFSMKYILSTNFDGPGPPGANLGHLFYWFKSASAPQILGKKLID